MSLAEGLTARKVVYCQWKGHRKADRWSRGEGDIDLLVERDSIRSFRSVLEQLSFKPALLPVERQIPGLESYYGHDPQVSRLLHVHAHYQLVLGNYWSTLYRLPIERPLLESARPGTLFRTPAPEYDLLISVLRMVQRYSGRAVLRRWPPRWLADAQEELDGLEARSDHAALGRILAQHLPCIEAPFILRCLRSLHRAEPRWRCLVLRRELHRRLTAHARRPALWTILLTIGREALPSRVGRRMPSARTRLAGGGRVLALLGGDGAGKSTCTRELHQWLSPEFASMTAHLGRPPRSLLTCAVGATLKAERALQRLIRTRSDTTSYVELLRHLCTARDRYLLYVKARRFAVAGGIVVSERYPIPQNRLLVGPSIPQALPATTTRFAQLLCDAEARYYRQILPPDVIFVLRLDPELAVRRKPSEPADYVRARGRVIWETDWTATDARVLDASLPLPDLLTELKSLVWSSL